MATDRAMRQARGRYRWPLILAAALLGHAGAMIGAVTIAVRDASFAVVPDYYQKAVAWDARRAAERASADLGWRMTLSPGSWADPRGQRLLRCRLLDASGAPIADAAVTISLYHHAHASTVQRLKLVPKGRGDYQALVSMPFSGFWSVEAEAVTPTATFVHTAELVLPAGEGP